MDVEAFLRDTPFCILLLVHDLLYNNKPCTSKWMGSLFFFFPLSFFLSFGYRLLGWRYSVPFCGSFGGRFMVRFNWRGGVFAWDGWLWQVLDLRCWFCWW